jgi:hypothetical protein
MIILFFFIFFYKKYFEYLVGLSPSLYIYDNIMTNIKWTPKIYTGDSRYKGTSLQRISRYNECPDEGRTFSRLTLLDIADPLRVITWFRRA